MITLNNYYYYFMFEAKLSNGSFLKKIVEAIKDVVNDVNIDVS